MKASMALRVQAALRRVVGGVVAAGFSTFGHVMQGSGHGIAPDGLGVALQFITERLAKS